MKKETLILDLDTLLDLELRPCDCRGRIHDHHVALGGVWLGSVRELDPAREVGAQPEGAIHLAELRFGESFVVFGDLEEATAVVLGESLSGGRTDYVELRLGGS